MMGYKNNARQGVGWPLFFSARKMRVILYNGFLSLWQCC